MLFSYPTADKSCEKFTWWLTSTKFLHGDRTDGVAFVTISAWKYRIQHDAFSISKFFWLCVVINVCGLTSSLTRVLSIWFLLVSTSNVQWWYAFGWPNLAAVPDIYNHSDKKQKWFLRKRIQWSQKRQKRRPWER